MRSTQALLVAVGLSLVAAGCGGKDKTQTFAVLDKYATLYGTCEVIGESKEVDGKPGWIASNVCKVKHRQTVLGELPDVDGKKFEGYFDEWKKAKGADAVAAARKSPATIPGSGGGGGGSGGSGGSGGKISESARIGIINDCNLGTCKGVGANNASADHLVCLEACCRSKGMTKNCRE